MVASTIKQWRSALSRHAGARRPRQKHVATVIRIPVRAHGAAGCAVPRDTHWPHFPSEVVSRVYAVSRIMLSGAGPYGYSKGLAEEMGEEGGAVMGNCGSVWHNPRRGGYSSAVCSCCGGGQGSSCGETRAAGDRGNRHGASPRDCRHALAGVELAGLPAWWRHSGSYCRWKRRICAVPGKVVQDFIWRTRADLLGCVCSTAVTLCNIQNTNDLSTAHTVSLTYATSWGAPPRASLPRAQSISRKSTVSASLPKLSYSPQASLPRARSPSQPRPYHLQFSALPRSAHAIQRRRHVSRTISVDSTVKKDCPPLITSTPSVITGSASLSPFGVGSAIPA